MPQHTLHPFFIFAIVGIIILSLPTAFGRAFPDLRVSGLACHADGSVSFTAENPSQEKLFLSTVTVRGTALPSNTTFAIAGNFSKPSISGRVQAEKKADFSSAKGLLNESGRYKITISYNDCKYQPCVKDFFLHNCPGFLYDCQLAAENFQVTSCSATDDKYFVTFQGLNTGQYQALDPMTQVAVYLKSNARTLATPFVAGKQLKDTGRDLYLMTFPRPAHENAASIGLGISGCPQENVRTCPVGEQKVTDVLLKANAADANKSEGKDRYETNETGEMQKQAEQQAQQVQLARQMFLLILLSAAVILACVIVILALIVIKKQ